LTLRKQRYSFQQINSRFVMSDLVRMSLSLENSLFKQMEKLVSDRGYENRSEFIRDLVRERLVSEEWESNEEAAATITLVYDHHVRLLNEKITHLQHHHHDEILATTHVHLDEDMCLEVIIVRGVAEHIRELADELRRQKGVLHTALSMSSAGRKLS
jgi:CopG family transcriptional regulator, nickel-responsive regulator